MFTSTEFVVSSTGEVVVRHIAVQRHNDHFHVQIREFVVTPAGVATISHRPYGQQREAVPVLVPSYIRVAA